MFYVCLWIFLELVDTSTVTNNIKNTFLAYTGPWYSLLSLNFNCTSSTTVHWLTMYKELVNYLYIIISTSRFRTLGRWRNYISLNIWKLLKDPSRSRKISHSSKFNLNWLKNIYKLCYESSLFSSCWIAWIHHLFSSFALQNTEHIYSEQLKTSVLFILFTNVTYPKNCG